MQWLPNCTTCRITTAPTPYTLCIGMYYVFKLFRCKISNVSLLIIASQLRMNYNWLQRCGLHSIPSTLDRLNHCDHRAYIYCNILKRRIINTGSNSPEKFVDYLHLVLNCQNRIWNIKLKIIWCSLKLAVYNNHRQSVHAYDGSYSLETSEQLYSHV